MVENYLGVYAKMTDIAYQPGGNEIAEFARSIRLGGIADTMPIGTMEASVTAFMKNMGKNFREQTL